MVIILLTEKQDLKVVSDPVNIIDKKFTRIRDIYPANVKSYIIIIHVKKEKWLLEIFEEFVLLLNFVLKTGCTGGWWGDVTL